MRVGLYVQFAALVATAVAQESPGRAAATASADGTAAVAAGTATDDPVLQQMVRFFAAEPAAQAEFAFAPVLDAELLTEAGDARLRALAWAAYRQAPLTALRADFERQHVSTDARTSAYKVQQVGERPRHGWGLVVAMHGGGGVATMENDQQWEVMQRYYRPHPEQGGYLYCALRAPNDSWNGFYDDAFYPLFERLLRQFVVCGDVDPDRVVAIGYSHGGYGAFALGPKLPHRFAAVHSSAAAPTDGESSPVGLHSLAFSFLVGGRDLEHGRRERCEAFGNALLALREQHQGQYATVFTVVEGSGHTGLPDRDLLPTLLAHRRDALPRELHWEPTDAVVHEHYWLWLDAPQKGQRIDAQLRGQELTVTRRGAGAANASLDARLCDLTQDLQVRVDGELRTVRLQPSLRTLCSSMQQLGDPVLAGSVLVALP